jgi:hypothetical protein
MNPPNIPSDDFQTVLFKELGLESVDSTKKSELVEQMAAVVQNRIALRIVDILDEQQLDQLNQLIESGDDAKVGEYLSQNVPDYQAIVAEEIRRLKAELYQDVADVNRAIETRPSQ